MPKDGCFRLDLRAIQRDMAEFEPAFSHNFRICTEQRAERLQRSLAEAADRPEVRRIEGRNHHKIVPFAASLRDPPRQIQPTRISDPDPDLSC